MKVCEIFSSIEGEGKRAGALCTFVRLVGCNLRCSYCDTTYSYEGGFDMSILDIVSEVVEYGNRCVTITGGEPLIHAGINELIHCLVSRGFEVNVETNGSQMIRELYWADNVFYTTDFKCFSSGQSEKMNMMNFDLAIPEDVFKFVVGDLCDLEQARNIVKLFPTRATIYFSPVWGKMDPKTIVEFIKNEPCLKDVRVQVQLHKIIWDPELRGV